MSRNRHKEQEDWDEEQDDDSDEDEDQYENEARPRQRRRRRQDEEEEYDRPQRRRGSWPCLLIGCVGGLLIVVLLATVVIFVVAGNGSIPVPIPGGGIGGVSNTSIHMQQSQQTLQLATIAQMQVHNQVGNVSITVDSGAAVAMVTTVKKVKAASSDEAQKEFGRISVQVQTDSSTNTLIVSVFLPDTGSNILSKESDAVDVMITLPPGVVRSTGVPLTLNADTSVGNVLVKGLNGMLVVKDSFGNVTVHQATLANGSHLETGTGDVVFDGALDTTNSANPQPTYKIQAEKGNVDVSLPASTNVFLDANVNVGSIKSDFAINVTSTGGSPSYYGPLIRSATPTSAVLMLDVSSGNIDLHQL